jgi:hypothetical protein
MSEIFVNDPGTFLTSGCGGSDTTISVASSSGYPGTGDFRIRVENEIMIVTGVSGTIWTVTRGAESTSNTSHSINTSVNAALTAGALTTAIGSGGGDSGGGSVSVSVEVENTQVGSVGNVSLTSWMLPFTPPVLTDFSWVNQGNATVDSTNPACLYLNAPAMGNNNLRILKQALTAPQTLTIAFSSLFLYANYNSRGIVLYDSVSGKAITFSLLYVSMLTYYVSEWSNLTGGSSDIFYNLFPAGLTPVVWMRIVYTNVSNVLFQYSPDGIHWKNIASAYDFSSFFSPDSIGFCVNPSNGTWDCDMTVVSYTLA